MGNECCIQNDNLCNPQQFLKNVFKKRTRKLKKANEINSIIVKPSKFKARQKYNITLSTNPFDDIYEKAFTIKANNDEAKSGINNNVDFSSLKIDLRLFRREKGKKSVDESYEIEHIIGQGGYGNVRRIKDKITGNYKALKTVSKNTCKMIENFATEIEIIKKLVITFAF